MHESASELPLASKRRWRQTLRSARAWSRLVAGASVAASAYHVGRAAGWLEAPHVANRRLEGRALGPSTFLCVYRAGNAASVVPLVNEARQLGMSIALWALDRPLPGLSAYTVGSGAGSRIDLLNRLWQEVARDDCGQLVVADDDISFTEGSLDRLLRTVLAAGFGIAQPAHDWRSCASYPITRKRPYALARLSNLVEPGPLFVLTRPWVGRVVPFPGDFGMGFGLWLLWRDLQPQGCRLGIVDCVTVNHPSPVGRAYASSRHVEHGRLRSLLDGQEIRQASDAQRTLGTWSMGQSGPPWLSDERS
jgi:hypothetical protein